MTDDPKHEDARAEALRLAQEAGFTPGTEITEDDVERLVVLARQPDNRLDETGYAARLARSLWEKHWKDQSPGWKPLPDLYGLLTQIDNMTCALARSRPGWKWVKDEIVANTRQDENGLRWCDLFEGGYRLPADTPLFAAIDAAIAEQEKKDA